MKQLTPVFDLYLKSSTHVSLSVVAFTGITMLHFGTTPDLHLPVFIFFATITGYNFVKYATIAKPDDSQKSTYFTAIQTYTIICFAGLLWTSLRLPDSVFWTAVTLGGLNLVYALPVFSGQKNLRNVTGIKIFVIALVWTGATVWLPVLEAHYSHTPDIVLVSLQRFLFVIVLTLPFDIRDLRLDTEQLGTVPQLVGVEKTRYIGLILLGSILVLEYFRVSADPAEIAVQVIVVILTAWLISKSVVRQNRYYAAFWVEGVPILWFLLLLIGKSI